MNFTMPDISVHDRHKLLSLVVPRPIVLVTTLNADATPNAAPFSFFNVISHDPPLLVIGIDQRPDNT